MIEIIQGLPENILAVIASGKVTGEDYEKVLIPAIEDKIRKYGKIRMLYQLGQDFTGFTYDAMWDDARVGIWHLTAFEKVAVVSDVDWIIDAVKIFKFVIPCPVKTFRNEEFPEAKAWIIE
ncbi:hypothetical protein MSLAZ_2151 [Methanosarcina lacustris Z-7289]|uniref:Amidases related to nicotinamidase n=1 Tax=Methanosarcina lacustris Z-7289 TaxID=1434111 RepID=A0A0E3S7K9_9EURY|nr:STAS/SEC14 domain-containing protein [Methanosarcina lacustris]AKB75412.1 hypothetical protein MSLAZ_2151 [Methanosarcina lacustris Z-7289]